jgi:hypothetical protein
MANWLRFMVGIPIVTRPGTVIVGVLEAFAGSVYHDVISRPEGKKLPLA